MTDTHEQYHALRDKLVEIAKSGEGQDLVHDLDRLWLSFTESMERWAKAAEDLAQLRKELDEVKRVSQEAMQKAALAGSMLRNKVGEVQGN